MVRQRLLLGLLGLSVLGVSAGLGWADNSGELFPDVKPYDEQVPSPVNKPEKSIDKSKLPAVLPTQPPVVPEPVVVPTPKPPAPDVPPPVVAKELKISWAPYRDQMLTPLLSPESQARFDKEFAPWIDSVLKVRGREIAAATNTLWQYGETPNMPVDLKTVLWLHALGLSFRDPTQLEERAVKAAAVLPLLKDETLPVAQARVDAATGLAFGALSKASDDLLGMSLESECKLARMQVKCGFPEEAEINRKQAQDILSYLKQKTDAQKDLLAETQAWVDRANAAHSSSAGWQKTLAATPDDPKVNSEMAELSLALFGDLEKAARYAAKSDRKELKDFAAYVDYFKTKTKDLSANAADSMAMSRTLLAVADNMNDKGQKFDQFAIALLAKEKLEPFADPANTSLSVAQQVRTVQTKATALIAKTGFKTPAFTALAAMQASADTKTGPGGAAKVQLFVKDNGTLVKYVKPTATENAEALKLIRTYEKDIGDKSFIKFVEVETDHCLVITDWDAAQQPFLKKNVEAAYLAVAKAFDYPVKENVFPGKLPVFMLKTHDEFLAFTKADSGREVFNTTGMFNTTTTGIGYILMYQPDQQSRDPNLLAEWGRTLTWNLGFAFEARYRTNKALPTWLNSGLAARVAFAQFPLADVRQSVHDFGEFGESIEPLFGNVGTNFQTQCVMSTIVEMLMAKDRKAFMDLVNKIKDGETQEAALKETFHCTPADLDKAWKIWAPRPDGGGY